jgi:hypothetical protein
MEVQNVKQLVHNYTGTDKFILSLKNFLYFKGYLSERQIFYAKKYFDNSAPVVTVNPNTVTVESEPVKPTYSMEKGQRVTIRKHFANNKAKELGYKVFFRNLIIEEVHAESRKAIEVTVSFDSKLSTYCHCCGLNLDTEVSQATGIGPICAKKYFGFKRVTMADAPAILARIEEETKALGTVRIWVPKSQFITKAEQILFNKE